VILPAATAGPDSRHVTPLCAGPECGPSGPAAAAGAQSVQDGAGQVVRRARTRRLLTGPVRIDWTRLRRLREEVEMTQQQVARGSRVSQGYISQIEVGRDVRSPTVDVADRLARALGISLSALLAAIGYNPGRRRRPKLTNLHWVAFHTLYKSLTSDRRRLVLALMRDMVAPTAEGQPRLHRFTCTASDGADALHSELAKVRGWR